jgi:hypothetical protein
MWIAICALVIAASIGACVVATMAPKDHATYGRALRK